MPGSEGSSGCLDGEGEEVEEEGGPEADPVVVEIDFAARELCPLGEVDDCLGSEPWLEGQGRGERGSGEDE